MLNKNEILAAYQWRHACKEFDVNKKIPVADWQFLSEIISLSPSSFGLQPYEVFVLRNEQLLKDLHPHMWGAQKQLFSASHVVMFAVKKDVTIHDDYFKHIVVDVQKTPAEMLELRTNLINNHQLNETKIGEPQRLVDWTSKQAYIALGNLMSAAAEIGIDSCPIEGFVHDKVCDILQAHNVIDMHKYDVSVFCCLGYRVAEPARAKTRKPLGEIIHVIE